MVGRVDWAKPESALDVNLGHEAPAQLHDGVNGVIDSQVAEWEVHHINAIIDALTRGVGEVHDEIPFARSLFWHDTQGVDDVCGECGSGEGACCVTSLALSC